MDWEALSCECESLSTVNSLNKSTKDTVFNANAIANALTLIFTFR